MRNKVLRFLPVIPALLVLAVPLRDLTGKLAVYRTPVPVIPLREDVTTQHDVPYRPGIPDNRVLPGTVIREQRKAAETQIVLAGTPRETAELFNILDRFGTVRTLTVERTGMEWSSRVHLSPSRHAGPVNPVTAAETAAEGFVEALLPVFRIRPPDPETGETPPPPDGDTAGNRYHAGTGATGAENAEVPFGMVYFHSGRRLSWRWNRDVLLLESYP